MESYVERLKFLINHMMLLSITHSEISEQYISGLRCALALYYENDDIETMKTKINAIFGIKE